MHNTPELKYACLFYKLELLESDSLEFKSEIELTMEVPIGARSDRHTHNNHIGHKGASSMYQNFEFTLS